MIASGTTGRLVYVVGPSGAGKDSLLRFARAHLPEGSPAAFAHRYITRPTDPAREIHIPLGETDFATRQRFGCFAMAWDSHGYRYGIGREIDLWLAAGLVVVVNGSRAYLTEAARRYPDLLPLLVRVDPAVLAARLAGRGQETPAEVAGRLRRAAAIDCEHPALRIIDNSAHLDAAGTAFVAVLKSLWG